MVFILTLVAGFTRGHRSYMKLFPNGERIPHPCNENMFWAGSGHIEDVGRGRLNAFGEHFKDAGNKWTKEVCEMDSDMDGMTNGQELGDPDCVWKPGMTPSRTVGITHPGVCNPTDSHKCEMYNTWVKCKVKELKCDAVNHTDTRNITLRFTDTKIPNTETNYYCMLFDLPTDRDYHLVATQPILVNKDIVHHMLVFGCDPSEKNFNGIPNRPYPCDMVPHEKCTQIIGTWTMGSPGECLHENVGFKLGKHGYRKAALQVHWNNPQLLSDMIDSSGLRLYYSPHLRDNEAGLLVTGEHYLEIAPVGTPSKLEYVSSCPGRCTKSMFDSNIYVTTAINHMHYLGITQRIELYRNGVKLRDITYDRFYEYDNPVIYTFNPPIEVRPGDEIRTTCVYKQPKKGKTVCFGEGTSDEMCYGFITYYPVHRLHKPWCTTRKSLKSCDRHYMKVVKPIDNCDFKKFLNVSNAETRALFQNVIGSCVRDMTNPEGSVTCNETCIEALKNAMAHPCLSGDVGSYVMNKFQYTATGGLLLTIALSCDCDSSVTKLGYCDRKTMSRLLPSNVNNKCLNRSARMESAVFLIASSLFFVKLISWLSDFQPR